MSVLRFVLPLCLLLPQGVAAAVPAYREELVARSRELSTFAVLLAGGHSTIAGRLAPASRRPFT